MYLVIEIQKTQAGQVSHIVTTHATQAEAEQKFHQILSYAAVTTLASHSATILTDNGYALRREFYEHKEEPEPEQGEGE